MFSESTLRTSQVVGGLLDIHCDETMVKGLLVSATGNFPTDELVHEVEQTHTSRLKIRPTSPKSLKSRIVLESMTTLFASSKWLANLFVSRELIQSWCMRVHDRLRDMEDFLSMTNIADVLEVGDKCELYQATRLLFTGISN
jgi:hypothetical protein